MFATLFLHVSYAQASPSFSEVSVEVGSADSVEDTSDLLGHGMLIDHAGLRVGLELLDFLTAEAGLHVGFASATWETTLGPLQARHNDQTLSVGPKVHVPSLGAFVPYAATRVTLSRNSLSLRENREDGGRTSMSGFAAGAVAVAGIELRAQTSSTSDTAFAVTLEGGWQARNGLPLGNVGTLNADGWLVRGGVGLRM